jgi:hypothetical protein
MNTLEELEKALQPLANRLPLVVDKGEIWTAEQTFEVDGDVDQYRSWLASCGSDVFGVLAVAAINALPGLIESARRVEEMRAALQDAHTWHESADKAISKQPNANQGANVWNRLQHQEQMELISNVLKGT